MPFTELEDAVQLIRMEYVELPGLTLTFWQAQRLWDLSDEVCARALKALTDARFLVRTREGAYVRQAAPPTPTECRHAAA
jgi:hypothetical protein